jgi:RecB family endonuclease NucS
MQIVRDPETDVALEFLQTQCSRINEGSGAMVQVIAECEVKYQGRAISNLNGGERVILIKPDGTLLIHTAQKAKPVNWQPPGAIFDARIQDEKLVLTAYRKKPEELVHITLQTIHVMLTMPLRDDADLDLIGSEADIQRLMFEHPQLIEDGFVPRRRERDSKRGFYDIDGDDKDGHRVIIELKRTTAGVKEAQQLWRYVEELQKEGRKVRGILMAPRVADKARSLLADHKLEWQEMDWAEILPKVEAMRHGGQVGLGRFD